MATLWSRSRRQFRLPAQVAVLVFLTWFALAGFRFVHALLGSFIAASLVYATWALRFGLLSGISVASIAAFFVSFFFLPIEQLFPIRDQASAFFEATAQLIPVLLIAFGIESGVVRAERHGEPKVVAIYLALLLTCGELASLLGLAAGERASVWHLYFSVAAIGAGLLATIGVMIIPERATKTDAVVNRDSADHTYEGRVSAGAPFNTDQGLEKSSECTEASPFSRRPTGLIVPRRYVGT